MTRTHMIRNLPVHAQSQRGFTLLELLISITMLGIILVIIITATRLGYRSVEAGEEKITSLERLRTSFSLVNSQLQSQIPLRYEDNGEQKVFFTGTRDSVRFASVFSLRGGRKGNVYVHYAVGTDNRGRQFLKASENLVATGSTYETLLFDDLDSCGFEYFFKDPTEESGSWVEEWTDTQQQPEKMRLSFRARERSFSSVIPLRAHLTGAGAVAGVQMQQTPGTGGAGGLPGPFR